MLHGGYDAICLQGNFTQRRDCANDDGERPKVNRTSSMLHGGHSYKFVSPVKAGARARDRSLIQQGSWIPACAGTTKILNK